MKDDIGEWFSASELAGLPGMPTSVFGVRKMASRLLWISRDREGQGAGRVYLHSSLPTKTLLFLEKRRREEMTAAGYEVLGNMKMKSIVELSKMPAHKQARADARLNVLRALDAYEYRHRITGRAAAAAFVKAYEDRDPSIELDPKTRARVEVLSVSTIYRWRKAERELGIVGLTDDYGSSYGRTKIDSDEELRTSVLALISIKPHIRAKHVTEYLRTKHGIEEISERTVERFLARWRGENASLWLQMSNPDAWKNRYQVAFGSASEGVCRLNQLWEMDSTPADVMLVDGRHCIIGVIDVYSRRFKLLVSKTSKATAVATLFRRGLVAWGVCESLKTDNGQDYKSNYFRAVVHALGVNQIFCLPYHGEQKPHVERAFRTFSHDIIELLPNYIGHNVPEREAIRARQSFADRLMKKGDLIDIRMTAAELQKECDRWCATYESRPHEGLDNATPASRVREWTEPVRRVSDERALDMLLAEAPQGGRTILKKGINVDRYVYIAPELGERIGERVTVRLDPDAYDRIYVYEADGGEFICIAECPELTGISRAAVAAMARERQQAASRKNREWAKEMKRSLKGEDIAAVIMQKREADAAKVHMLPRPFEEHSTPQLEAASDAARAAAEANMEPLPALPERPARRDPVVLELVSQADRDAEEREAADKRVRDRYAAMCSRDPDTLLPAEATWLAHMHGDPMIVAWKAMADLEATTSNGKKSP